VVCWYLRDQERRDNGLLDHDARHDNQAELPDEETELWNDDRYGLGFDRVDRAE